MAYVSRIDRHSFWVPAPQAEAPLGTSVPSPVEVDPIGDEIAVVKLGAFTNPDPAVADAYVNQAHAALADLGAGVCGVVVDLSSHTGGNMWPGLAALAPLNAGDPVGFFVRGEDDRSAWYVDPHGVGVADSVVLAYPTVPKLDVPLAVVFGSRTGSSGEAVVLSLLGQDGVRSFGAPTVGKASANTSFPLSDGSAVFLTTTLMADRSGVPVPAGPANRTG